MARSDGEETRARLLLAAEKVFAAKGFHEAKTTEICQLAQANPAAVNYYFGSKENLYQEAWRDAFDRSVALYPPDGGLDPEAPVEERFKAQLRAIMNRVLDPDSLDFDIARREMANPTGLLDEVMHRAIEPLHQRLMDIVREFLGPKATEQEVFLGVMSVHAQCFGSLLHEREFKNRPGNKKKLGPFVEEIGVEAMADHVLRFSLAGLRAMKDRADSPAAPAVGKKGE